MEIYQTSPVFVRENLNESRPIASTSTIHPISNPHISVTCEGIVRTSELSEFRNFLLSANITPVPADVPSSVLTLGPTLASQTINADIQNGSPYEC